MQRAIDLALKAQEAGEVPVGAVVFETACADERAVGRHRPRIMVAALDLVPRVALDPVVPRAQRGGILAIGNAVASIVISAWEGGLDRARLHTSLRGGDAGATDTDTLHNTPVIGG